jgi:hypothetical protein
MSSEFSTTCKIGERFQSPSRPVAQSPRSTIVRERNRGTASPTTSLIDVPESRMTTRTESKDLMFDHGNGSEMNKPRGILLKDDSSVFRV